MSVKLSIYVIHVDAFQFRKMTCERLREALTNDKRFQVSMQYITDHDPQTITQDEIRNYVNYEHIDKESPLSIFNPAIKNLHLNNLSNSLKHRHAIHLASESAEDEINLIIEDDIIFNDNVADSLYTAIMNLPEGYAFMFLGLPSNKEIENKAPHQNLEEVFKVLPACDSYIISKNAAKTIYDEYAPIKFTNNIQLSYLIAKTSIPSYLNVPNVFIDGSKLGLYFSSLEVNNRLIFNQDYINLSRSVLERDTYTDEEKKVIDQMFKDIKLKTNPEFYYLKALYEDKKGSHLFSKAIFDYTYDLYEQNGTIMNNQSSFLRDYMRVFKHLQDV
jgi:hypothetical protein